jgi:hypothetical protein
MSTKRCQICNDLDPRGHVDSNIEPKTTPKVGPNKNIVTGLILRVRLTDLIDNCSFCKLLTSMIDLFASLVRGEGLDFQH